MIGIKKRSSEYILWKKRNDYKRFKGKHKRRKGKIVKNKKNVWQKYFFDAPERFSIKDNSEQTITFINELINKIIMVNNAHITSKKILFFVNMLDINYITSDALMYLITIIKQTRLNKNIVIHWKGNFPRNIEVNEYFRKSGFLKYFNTAEVNLLYSQENIQITSGNNVEPNHFKKICDFVSERVEDNRSLKFLYSMLTELTTNTMQHAYDGNNIFDYSWYIFVENVDDRIKITFMDNGIGILKSINKRFRDKLKYGYVRKNKQYEYIISALKGECRSNTKLSNRGKGLPEVYEPSLTDKITNLTIISDIAYYNKENSRDLNEKLKYGTIFYWEIEK